MALRLALYVSVLSGLFGIEGLLWGFRVATVFLWHGVFSINSLCSTTTRPLEKMRQPATKKSGGQPGHPGTTLKQVAEPEQVLTHAPQQCASGGTALHEVAGRLAEERRQFFELPPLKLVGTEHRVVRKECPRCGQENSGAFPEGVTGGASCGPGVKDLPVRFSSLSR